MFTESPCWSICVVNTETRSRETFKHTDICLRINFYFVWFVKTLCSKYIQYVCLAGSYGNYSTPFKIGRATKVRISIGMQTDRQTINTSLKCFLVVLIFTQIYLDNLCACACDQHRCPFYFVQKHTGICLRSYSFHFQPPQLSHFTKYLQLYTRIFRC